MINVAITDDHPLVVEGLRNILSTTPHINVVATYSNASETVACEILQKTHVLLLDINLPDKDGIMLCSELMKIHPHLKVIGLTSHAETSFLKNMMRAGACGYLLKSAPAATVVEAIREVCSGKEFIQTEMKELLISESLHKSRRVSAEVKLTRREKEILSLIADEFTTQEIANRLFVSAKTIETHRQNLMLKLGVKNSVGLVKQAMERGLI